MSSRSVVIGSKVGLHARPAALFAKAARSAPLPVRIAKGDGDPVKADSLLALLTLNAHHGDRVTLFVDGDGAEAEAVLGDLGGMLERELDE